jgi:hypothetical protein
MPSYNLLPLSQSYVVAVIFFVCLYHIGNKMEKSNIYQFTRKEPKEVRSDSHQSDINTKSHSVESEEFAKNPTDHFDD